MDETDFLDGMVGAGQAVEVAAEEPAIEPTKPRDEHGRFATKETGVEPQPVTEAEQVSPTPGLPKEEYEAVKAERKRRQAAEERLAALEQQMNPPAPPPSIWEDEQQAFQHRDEAVLSRANQLSRINASEMAARSQYPDFQDMFDRFNEMATQNPAIVQQAMTDPHPWNKAYQIAANAARMEALGAVDVADMETKLRAQIEAEYTAKAATAAPVLPQSLADAQSGNVTNAQPAPFTLKDILG